MKTVLVGAMIAALFLFQIPADAAEEVSVTELIEMSAELAGKEVTVEGELVGDYGFRDDGWMWTQLNDDVYVEQPLREGGSPAGGNTGIGIRMPIDMARDLDDPGGYRRRGPVVQVTGIWKYHDPERQGESFLEVAGLEVTEPGRQLEEKGNPMAAAVGVVLIVAAAIVWWRTPRENRPLGG